MAKLVLELDTYDRTSVRHAYYIITSLFDSYAKQAKEAQEATDKAKAAETQPQEQSVQEEPKQEVAQ